MVPEWGPDFVNKGKDPLVRENHPGAEKEHTVDTDAEWGKQNWKKGEGEEPKKDVKR